MKAEFLQETDFEMLIPLIKEFSTRTNVPFIQQMHEISSSFTSNSVFVFVVKDDENLICGYFCGYFIAESDFYVSQGLSHNQPLMQKLVDFIESEMQLKGVKRIFGLTLPSTTNLFERYGYKIERHLVSKILNKEEEK